MKKRSSKLEGNVILAMRAKSKLEHNIHSYFSCDSRFFKALRKHIIARENLIIDLPYDKGSLFFVPGQGPVFFKNAFAYGTQFDKDSKPYEPTEFDFEFTVYFNGDFGEMEFEKSYTLRVPVNLEDDQCSDVEFQERFDAWIEVKRAELVQKKAEKDLKLLAKLVKNYPEATKQLLQSEELPPQAPLPKELLEPKLSS